MAFESEVALQDGSLVRVRPVREDDRPLLMEFIKAASPETLRLRFGTAAVPEAEVTRLIPGPDDLALVALRDGRVVAHVCYRSLAPGRAEAAAIVADAYQGKGLGRVLMGQLAEAASRNGISTFEVAVAAENVQMLTVLGELGFPTLLKVEPGVVRIASPTSLRPEVLELFEQRESVSAVAALQGFFRPRSVAVVGASRERGTIGGELFRNILGSGFDGVVYPVNRNAGVVQSVVAYPSVVGCPGPVDLAIIAVPAAAVLQVARDCAEKVVRSIVVISAGFAESGTEGARLQQELSRVCADAGMRLIGPNCMGIVNTDPGVDLNAQFSPLKPARGRMGFLSQSGALGIAVIDQANHLGLGMSTFVSVGNKADVSGNDLIQYWEKDDKTDLILLYLESFGNPRKFARIARRVARKKPILAVKSGRSAAGFRATQSHTGALLATSDITVDALFRQSGVIRVNTLAEMFDIAALLTAQPIPRGNRVAIVTNAGGAGILAADACEDLGLKVPELSPATQEALRGFLHQGAGVKNPVDMIASASPADYARTIRTVLGDAQVDALLVIFVPPLTTSPREVADQILEATRADEGREGEGRGDGGIPVLAIFMATHGISDFLTEGKRSIPAYPFPESAVHALAHAVRYGEWRAAPEGEVRRFEGIRRDEAAAIVAAALAGSSGISSSTGVSASNGLRWLSQEDTSAVLDCYGIHLVRTERVKTPEDAGKAAEEIGGSVALKGVAPGLVHKTDMGAVRVNLAGAREVKEAAEEIEKRLVSLGLAPEGFLVQPMAPPGLEMLVGVTRDPVFGPVVACGAGGTLVELLKDVSVRITPLTDRDAGEMLRSLKTYPLLTGYRGGPQYDIGAVEETVLRVGALVEDLQEIAELDLNPLIVMPAGRGLSIVDARIQVAETKSAGIPLGAERAGAAQTP